jgi:hypothetical protein
MKEKSQERIVGISAKTQTQKLQNTYLGLYRYISVLGLGCLNVLQQSIW